MVHDVHEAPEAPEPRPDPPSGHPSGPQAGAASDPAASTRRTRLGWPVAPPSPRSGPLGWPHPAADAAPADPDPADDHGAQRGHVSRETPAPGWPTAADVAETAAPDIRAEDLDTPLAVAIEHEVRLAYAHRDHGPLERPPRTRILVVANQKGGVGKTTTAVNVAAGLAQWEQRVLLIDLDPQGNASTALGIAHTEGTPGVYEALIAERPVRELVRDCPDLPGLTVLPATIDLAGAEIDLVSLVARESRLRRSLSAYLAECEEADERFDYVFIDCPPSLGLLTVNALVAGEEILLPIQCEYYALEGVGQLLRTVEMVKSHLNPGLRVSTILLTMHDARTRLSAGVAEEVRTHFPDQVLRTAIPRSVRISEAPSYQQTVITYDPGSPGALSYLEAAREIGRRSADPDHQPQQAPEQAPAQPAADQAAADQEAADQAADQPSGGGTR